MCLMGRVELDVSGINSRLHYITANRQKYAANCSECIRRKNLCIVPRIAAQSPSCQLHTSECDRMGTQGAGQNADTY
ncbi:unnamed protein product [Fusarium graminearum]|uniref:Uncharacterized protein n=1 Tax=Gibberella zeae TaxID=5518 RepID=A0A4E9ENB3_GIBZA|nr:unnamed protein product [Fusarium graminearum]CAG1980823.1 unnamed protein product [Fusarium graminearum]CAG2005043.1 unnamed protein product [Fusarium graminearum]